MLHFCMKNLLDRRYDETLYIYSKFVGMTIQAAIFSKASSKETVSLKLSQESKQQTEQQNQDSQPLRYVNLEVAKNCVKAAKEHEEIDTDAKQVFAEILQLFLKPQVPNIF